MGDLTENILWQFDRKYSMGDLTENILWAISQKSENGGSEKP